MYINVFLVKTPYSLYLPTKSNILVYTFRLVSLVSFCLAPQCTNYLLFPLLQEVLQVTRTQLERELSLEDVNRIQDLPAYNLLYQ
jgi:hypothetical protein